MKPQTLIGLAAVTVIGLSACSQTKTSPQNSSTSSKTYQVNTQEATAKRVVYRQPAVRADNKAPHQQRTVFQQVRNSRVKKPKPPRVAQPARPNPTRAKNAELFAIGDQIFKNETGGKIDLLVHWNHREDFAAMGIGHFTWYPAGRRARFGNTFPGLLDYLQKNGVKLPHWVQRARFEGAPWRTREELMRVKNTPEIRQFAQLLYQTRNLQAQYIMDRAMRAMPRLVKKTPQHLRGHVAKNLNDVANSHGGRYVLVDYVNFKGEGLNRHGGYKGHNWGLLQVLEEMRPSNVGPQALNEFANAAMRVLERRVRNSKPSRNERKWLPGWRNRTNTYRNPI
ncbi:MAG: hypothetical protein V3U64_01035 [Cocleimonas sp.]